MSMAMLALIAGGIMGPITVPGLTTTTSNPFPSANSQAAFSANVFDAGYHNWRGQPPKHAIREMSNDPIHSPANSILRRYILWSYLILPAILEVGPTALLLHDISWPSGARKNGRYGRRHHHPAHSALLGGAEYVKRPLHGRIQ